MAGTNPDETVVDDDLDVSEEGLRALKEANPEVETPEGDEDESDEADDSAQDDEDAGDEADQIDDETNEDEDDSADADEEESFVKEFPNIKGDTPEEYAKNLEIAYKNSTAEAMRLKGVAEAPPTAPQTPEAPADAGTEGKPAATPPMDALTLFAKQELDKQINAAYSDFQKDYPQVVESDKYKQFTDTVKVLSRTIFDSQGRLAGADELYPMAATALGWEKQSLPSKKEELDMALKSKGATSKGSTSSRAVQKQPKVSQAMLEANRKMYPGKTDAEIIKELTPYL